VRASPKAWAWRLCSKADSSKDNPLAAPAQVPSSIGATSTRTSATACPMTSTWLCRGRPLDLDGLAWSWAGPATRHNFCPRAPAGCLQSSIRRWSPNLSPRLPSSDGITDSTAAQNSSEITPIRVTGQSSLVNAFPFGRHALGTRMSPRVRRRLGRCWRPLSGRLRCSRSRGPHVLRLPALPSSCAHGRDAPGRRWWTW
jgi:hypothetical protein